MQEVPSFTEYRDMVIQAMEKWVSSMDTEIKPVVHDNKEEAQTLIHSWKKMYPQRRDEIDIIIDKKMKELFV